MTDRHPHARTTCIVRNTAARKGRTHRGRARPTADRGTCTTAGSSSTPATRRRGSHTGERETASSACAASATVDVRRRSVTRSAATTRSTSRATASIDRHAGRRRLRPRRDRGAGEPAASGAVRRASPRCARTRRSTSPPAARGQARSQRAARQERPGRTDHGRRHLQRARQLDVVAAARARRDARGGLPLHRHAGAGVRRAARLHQRRASRRSPPSSARATSC